MPPAWVLRVPVWHVVLTGIKDQGKIKPRNLVDNENYKDCHNPHPGHLAGVWIRLLPRRRGARSTTYAHCNTH